MVRSGELVKKGVAQSVRSFANSAFQRMFAPGRLTFGVFFPIEAFERDQPTMRRQERLARRAEELGFTAVWFRDVPLRDPNFGDVGQIYDPWVYLGWIAAHTQRIVLATGSIILPLRHPLHTAKASASVDQLSGGRFLLGVASGDRPIEFPAFAVAFEKRDALFRENLRVIREVLQEDFPDIRSHYGVMTGGADLIPKPRGRLPIFITSNSRQDLDWIAENSDGWIMYPRPLAMQLEIVAQWQAAVRAVAPGVFKPFVQSLYVDLAQNRDEPSTPIHLGFRGGRNFLLRFLEALRSAGVNHVILNLKYGRRSADEVLDEIGEEVLPQFAASEAEAVVA